MIVRILRLLLLGFALGLPVAVNGQGAVIDLGGINADPNAPVEVSADSLTVDQDSRQAVFAGNVVIGQGDMRIAADRVEVVYAEASGRISHLKASGGVTFVTATEAAEAAEADYDIDAGLLILTGNVLLTQGGAALSADRMVVNLADGTAQMTGRVRTVIQPSGGN